MERGITVRNQAVLQRGVNDTVETMTLLVKRLSHVNVHPYYVYVHDLVKGVEDLRTTLETALEIEKHVRGSTAGFNTPTFVVDAPGRRRQARRALLRTLRPRDGHQRVHLAGGAEGRALPLLRSAPRALAVGTTQMAGPGRGGGDDQGGDRAGSADGKAVQRGGSRRRQHVRLDCRGKGVAMMPASACVVRSLPPQERSNPMTASEAALWLPARRSLDAPRVRLLCLPYAGGGATIYRAWSAAGLPADVEVRPVQLPARQNRRHETPLTRVDAIVTPPGRGDRDAAAGAARDLRPQLRRPRGLRARPAPERRGNAAARARDRRASCAAPAASRRRRFTPWRTEAFVETLHRRYGTAWTLLRNPELMALAQPSLRADFAAYESYEYKAGPRLEAPITVLHGLQRRDADARAGGGVGRPDKRRGPRCSRWTPGTSSLTRTAEWVLAQVRRALAAA